MKKFGCLFLASVALSLAQTPDRPLSMRAKVLSADSRMELAPLDTDAKPPRPKHPTVRAVGLGRTISPRLMQHGEWSTLASGQNIWRVSLRSPQAWGMRLHFTDFHAGDGKVWLYPKGGDLEKGNYVGPYRADGLFHDGEFWSEPVQGEEIVLEYAPADP